MLIGVKSGKVLGSISKVISQKIGKVSQSLLNLIFLEKALYIIIRAMHFRGLQMGQYGIKILQENNLLFMIIVRVVKKLIFGLKLQQIHYLALIRMKTHQLIIQSVTVGLMQKLSKLNTASLILTFGISV